MFGRRPDAKLVRDLPAIRRFMPFISPRRNDSLVWFAQDVDAEPALEWIDTFNAGRPAEARLTFFHLVLRGLVRVLDERPRLNRFVTGGRVWQRDGIWISFSAKKRMSDDAPITTLKLRFDPAETLSDMVTRIHEALGEGRSDRKSTADREVDLLLRLPPSLIRLGVRAVRGLDALGLLPTGMIEPDPMYASVFVANLGSVGLDAGYHHLWEYGNVPIFCVLGRVQADAQGRRRVELKFTYDERVEDGLYCARGLAILRGLLEKPADLAG